MRYVFVVATFFFSLFLYSNKTGTISLENLRLSYIKAIEDSETADNILEQLSKVSPNNPMLYGYKGAFEALVAKHSWNPYTKYDYLSKAMKTLETAIKNDKNNAEIRFLRFSIQHYIPSFLGFSTNLEEDKEVILKTLKYCEPKVKLVIKNFLKTSERCTPSELKMID